MMQVSTYQRKTGETATEVQICRADMKGKVFSIEDKFDVSEGPDGARVHEKLQISMNEYDPSNQGGKSVRVKHYIDIEDALVLAHDLLNSPETVTFPAPDFKGRLLPDYKGSPNKAYSTGYEARTFQAKAVDSSQGDGKKVQIKVTNGPGVAGEKGAVSPAKDSSEPIKEVTMYLDTKVARTLGAQILTYVQAKATALLIQKAKVFGL